MLKSLDIWTVTDYFTIYLIHILYVFTNNIK